MRIKQMSSSSLFGVNQNVQQLKNKNIKNILKSKHLFWMIFFLFSKYDNYLVS